ncbi:hypothetical protein AUQ48_10175 [Kocuria flava]|uniref:N-acetyltransferase domain-containing protein n=1 Tax=Kocuria flava TaxID=446860 RepID=A0A2N4T2R4_9MICC|nr:GNAT family N-acetyltransferase [Kocuria flava]PLC12521.1 hypothetical protein AUQ48_10175 [Kocuria flava]
MLTLRALDRGDRAAVVAFLLADPAHARTCFDRDPVPADADDLLSSAGYGPGRHRHALVGAFDDDVLVGLLDLVLGWPTPQTAYLGLVHVHPGRRRAGVGAALLAHAEQEARDGGCRQLMLSVVARHHEARAHWHRRGFRPLTARGERAAGPLESVVMHRPVAAAPGPATDAAAGAPAPDGRGAGGPVQSPEARRAACSRISRRSCEPTSTSRPSSVVAR